MANTQLEDPPVAAKPVESVSVMQSHRQPDPSTPSQRELAFRNFGVLDAGKQTKSSVATSLIVNGIALLLVLLVSLTAKKVLQPQKVTTLTAPVMLPKEPPPPPKPPVKLPPPPVVKVTPPPVPPDVPKIEVPEPPKVQPVVTKAAPTPTPAPKAVTPPPAPRPVAINIAQAASVPNNDPHPTAVRLGSLNNPINNTAGPAVSPVNLGRSGAPGMPAGNTGFGPPSKVAIAGSGSPNGSMGGHDNAPQPIRGINTGITGGTGPMSARPVGAVQIARNNAPVPVSTHPPASPSGAKSAPKLLFKPRPEYTEEARQLHLEGTVYVKIHVAASGAVSVLGVQSGLGHGLDQAAVRAVQGMRFQPAQQNGEPTDWDGVVNVNFQLAG